MTMRRRGGATTFSICIPVCGSPIRTSGYNIEGTVHCTALSNTKSHIRLGCVLNGCAFPIQ
jgi:hypothetical protein